MSKENTTSPEYNLKLFITGASPNSIKAVQNLKKICEAHIPGRYRLEVIDIYQQPEVASREQVIAVPLLIRLSPAPGKRLIGNMSDTAQVLKGLQIPEKAP
ncbi:MAG: circadian clock protein KaiB [Chitinophagaceae bacterium]|nr:MAG: circadian clock protein KaiB [Chitinophagaceae bacterium]